MRSVYELGVDTPMLAYAVYAVGLIYLLKIYTCVPSFRLDFFPANFLSVANTVNELIEVFDERR